MYKDQRQKTHQQDIFATKQNSDCHLQVQGQGGEVGQSIKFSVIRGRSIETQYAKWMTL